MHDGRRSACHCFVCFADNDCVGSGFPVRSKHGIRSPPPPFLPIPVTPALPWLTWERSFHTFLEAAGCDTLREERKTAVLLSNLGFAGQHLCYDLMSQVDPATIQFQDIIRRLDKHYENCTNGLVHRITFRYRRQPPGFGASHDESLRGQIVHGVASTIIHERLLYEGSSLTLKKAEEIGQSVEQVHKELHKD
ncbi:hypothetical protein HPB49_014794 [Dermacentor silvarum]|uniref:Uncharacterized protein n=1 Tax=Dermacentor silvarum TaxID=543639 RepID=A0ACB8CYA8_DERSI|nr:hypothetical protein HPB49_014794 [Dermacentor silvarum]